MRCPYCGCVEQRVLDSRPARDGEAIRRRRECVRCRRRFTTFEEYEKPRLFVVKRGGVREEFAREKVLNGMVVACRKRNVPMHELQAAADRVERDLFDLMVSEVPSTEVGERVMKELLKLDTVAYVRFASVYREFHSPAEFADIVDTVRKLEPEPLIKADV